jgi:glycerol-3-phosphate acyltransferase PlsX
MSGDHGLRVTVPAALHALQANPRLYLYLVGDEPAIQAELSRHPCDTLASRFEILHAPYALAHDASLAQVLRGTPDSSMHQGLALVAETRAHALVSAGPTAALLALGRQVLQMLPGFKRPAFCSAMPVRQGHSYMLDLGANVDCSAEQLHDFARMGSALVCSLHGIERPRVGLLSNGQEDSKGNAIIREAAQRLQLDSRLHYTGYIEGNEIHQGELDVIVCDGLLGNISLKSAEGTATLARELIAEQVRSTRWSQLLGLFAAPLLRRLSESLEGERHGGAFLLGLQGLVVKSHGGAGIQGFAAAILQATRCLEQQMLPRMAHYLDNQEVI